MIRYVFEFPTGNKVEFLVDSESDTSNQVVEGPIPQWLKLENHKCDVCTLPEKSRETCPAALAIKPVLEEFARYRSYETVKVSAISRGVTMSTTVQMQVAIQSLVGLLLALSSCPVMTQLRPMAYFHLPFGGQEHVSFRFLGMHLIAQYLRYDAGLKPDWKLEKLLDLFKDIHRVNARLADRIRATTDQDATVNSLIILDALADQAALNVETHLDELKPLFAAYLQD